MIERVRRRIELGTPEGRATIAHYVCLHLCVSRVCTARCGSGKRVEIHEAFAPDDYADVLAEELAQNYFPASDLLASSA